jgi:hypothetical protein
MWRNGAQAVWARATREETREERMFIERKVFQPEFRDWLRADFAKASRMQSRNPGSGEAGARAAAWSVFEKRKGADTGSRQARSGTGTAAGEMAKGGTKRGKREGRKQEPIRVRGLSAKELKNSKMTFLIIIMNRNRGAGCVFWGKVKGFF